MSTTIHFSGLNTEPVSLIRLASDSRYRAYPQTSLLTCWLNFSQVGLEALRLLTHWVTITNFIVSYSQGFGFTLARGFALLAVSPLNSSHFSPTDLLNTECAVHLFSKRFV